MGIFSPGLIKLMFYPVEFPKHPLELKTPHPDTEVSTKKKGGTLPCSEVSTSVWSGILRLL